MTPPRIVLFAGHYGSGKTNIAVNYSISLAQRGEKVTLADLDIVNPYFRTKDSAEDLKNAGVRLIVSAYANTNVDIPALPQEMYDITDDTSSRAIVDVGGDDRGALALGRLTPAIHRENSYEMLLVVNKYRPLTATAQDVYNVMREIESAGGIQFTGFVNNSNLGEETSPETVLDSMEYTKEITQLTGLPLRMTTVKEDIYSQLSGKIDNLFPLILQKKIK